MGVVWLCLQMRSCSIWGFVYVGELEGVEAMVVVVVRV